MSVSKLTTQSLFKHSSQQNFKYHRKREFTSQLKTDQNLARIYNLLIIQFFIYSLFCFLPPMQPRKIRESISRFQRPFLRPVQIRGAFRNFSSGGLKITSWGLGTPQKSKAQPPEYAFGLDHVILIFFGTSCMLQLLVTYIKCH